jgi:hypothetical protein
VLGHQAEAGVAGSGDPRPRDMRDEETIALLITFAAIFNGLVRAMSAPLRFALKGLQNHEKDNQDH